MEKIRTGISKAFWCTREEDEFVFQPAFMPSISSKEQVSWFDELFEGGIAIPTPEDGQNRALTILVSGPPGSGKSTFVLELAHRLRKENCENQHSDKWHTLYVTSESSEDWLLEKFNSYGWNDQTKIHGVKAPLRPEISHVDIVHAMNTKHYLVSNEAGKNTKNLLDALSGLLPIFSGRTKTFVEILMKFIRHVLKIRKKNIHDLILKIMPDVLIVDSLNTVQYKDRTEIFNKFTKLITSGPKIIVIVLDSYNECGNCEFWGYVCDSIIRLDKKYDLNYMIRTMEIIKARYQSHAWGIHQLKIYGPNKVENLKGMEARKRAHPYREEGGIFIFPSIHYYLSKYKRESPHVDPELVETRLEGLNKLLGGGFPLGRCTGFMGQRGNHKSHLGYQHILYRIIKYNEKGLIISLRDDEAMARKTLKSILSEEFDITNGEERLKLMEEKDNLEILYYPPGYITPEEFFHRMYLSIQRLKYKDSNANITLLFNSLDQLGSRFPLCSQERVFIPGIIETLSAERITSIFIGVDEPGQPPEQYGLLSMADLILSFEKRVFLPVEYLGHLNVKQTKIQGIKEKLGQMQKAVVVRVERFSGGQAAGKGGILELVEKTSHLHDVCNNGLYFKEFSPKFSQGRKEEMLAINDLREKETPKAFPKE